jgi:hypothetical protein
MTAKEIDNLPIEELEMLAESLTLEERDCWSHNGYDGETYVYIMQTRKG